MRRFCRFLPFVLGVLILLAGCTRNDESPYSTEKDDPSYQNGKSLEQQGRDQEALGAFLKIIAKRGEDAPESHLEAGLLYQDHVKDPITAIYYYKKYLELAPNSPQASLVRGRIAACMRDFARTLPGQPLGSDALQPDLSDVVDRLQKENDALKSELAALRANRPAPASETAETSPPPAQPEPDTVADAPRPVITRAPMTTERPAVAPVHASAAHSGMTLSSTATGHTHTVSKGDTLMSLSQHYYGTKSKWRDIYAANRDVLKSDNDLKVGMQLKIP
ncbi:MAG TPA: LysM peptidoglycan-binding domain-containing protein [Opitutaceae bacterium]|jgi:LysM repeat protein|nr:LysM peptidoglycan-binding domain-containing protein [Opitutaceae bacterium]